MFFLVLNFSLRQGIKRHALHAHILTSNQHSSLTSYRIWLLTVWQHPRYPAFDALAVVGQYGTVVVILVAASIVVFAAAGPQKTA
jgi:hypothetical protein